MLRQQAVENTSSKGKNQGDEKVKEEEIQRSELMCNPTYYFFIKLAICFSPVFKAKRKKQAALLQ